MENEEKRIEITKKKQSTTMPAILHKKKEQTFNEQLCSFPYHLIKNGKINSYQLFL